MADFDYVSRADATAPKKGPKGPADLSHHFSRVTAKREESKVKKFYKYFQIPGIGNLSGGLPNAAHFPYDTLEAQIAQPERFKPTPNDPNDPSELSRSLSLKKGHDVTAAAHLTVPHASATPNPLQKIDLTTALQYGTAQGYPPLYSFLRQFATEHLHPNIPYAGGADIILTNGNTDGLAKTIEALSNIWDEDRDWIRERPGLLVEEFAYMNAVQAGKPRGLQIVPVKIDLEGMLSDGPGGLEDVLANWDEKKGRRPHLMYTVTIGQNPTSGTLSIQRRKDIYALCSKYDVIIMEDDPYWYLQFPSSTGKEASARGNPLPTPPPPHKFEKSTGFEFLDSLVPSYLNFDTDGRVVRLDTFSKTVAPGCRLGWITAQPAIIERILRITETSTQQPSGFVQSMIATLLMGPQPEAVTTAFNKKSKNEQLDFTGWQMDGWVRWLAGLRGTYEHRMNRMCNILEEGRFLLKQGTSVKVSESDWAVISKTKMYSFDWPRGGMFIWMQVHYESHPLWGQVAGPKMAQALWTYLAQKYLVLLSPGLLFSPTDQIAEEKGWQFFRLCFAAVNEDEVDKSSKRTAEGIKNFWLIKDKKELEDIEESVNGLDMQEGLMDLGMNWAC